MIKKVVVFFLSVLAIAAMSCQNSLQDTNAGTSDSAFVESKPIVVEASNKMSESFQSYTALQAEYLIKSYELIEQYIDVSENVSKSAPKNGLSLTEFGNLLPDDISNLTRTIVVRGVEEEITLEQELNELENNFEKKRTNVLPDTTDAKKLDYLVIDDENIYMGGVGIPLNSIEGVMAIEVYNAVSRGEDVEQKMAEMLEDIENSFLPQFEIIEDEADSKGLYKIASSTPRWPDGVVKYRWGDISETHKKALKDAMADWSSSTGEVSFSELPNSWWNNLLLNLGIIRAVKCNTKELGGPAGNAKFGYSPWSNLNLDPDSVYPEKPAAFKRVPLHELGHVLGLYHEHQRSDRDTYVLLESKQASDKVNFGKLNEYTKHTYWITVTVRFLWFRWSYSYPFTYTTGDAISVSSFDFDSIMLYSTLDIRKPYQKA